MEDFDEELAVKRIVNIINESYNESKNIADLSIQKKERNDIVTEIDLFMEKNIMQKLSQFYPTFSFYAEESGETLKDTDGDFFEWIIDPIDGTINFASGFPDFGVVVALQKNGETILGVTVLPKLGEVYTSIKGKGAFCNGKKIFVSSNEKLENSMVMIYLGTKHKGDEIIKSVKLIEKLVPLVRGVRIVGSSAVSSSYVACGKVDAIINLKIGESLGSSAGRLFIEESGGKVTNILGYKRKKVDSMVCSNSKLHNEFLKIINEVL